MEEESNGDLLPSADLLRNLIREGQELARRLAGELGGLGGEMAIGQALGRTVEAASAIRDARYDRREPIQPREESGGGAGGAQLMVDPDGTAWRIPPGETAAEDGWSVATRGWPSLIVELLNQSIEAVEELAQARADHAASWESFWRRVDHEPGADPAFDEALAALGRATGPELRGSEEERRLEEADFSAFARPLEVLLDTLADELGRVAIGPHSPHELRRPVPAPVELSEPVEPLVLKGPSEPPILFGEALPRPLTEEQYCVIHVLCESHPRRLKTSTIKDKVRKLAAARGLRHSPDFAKVLRGLAKDDRWAAIISSPGPGGQHRGYGLTLDPLARPARQAQT